MTVWNTLVVLLASLMALVAVREGMRLTIEKETRDLLREEAVELELAVRDLRADQVRLYAEFDRKVMSHGQHNWFSALIDDNGKTLYQSTNFPDQADFAKGYETTRSFEFLHTPEHLLVRHSLRTQQGEQLVVVLGQPTRFIATDVWNLTKIMLVIGFTLLIVAPIGGYFLARHATKPVRDIIKTTRALKPAHLDQRLTIRGTDDELDQISFEINQFVDQISKYLTSHREFIGNAAHELRSPLTAIQTSVEVTLEKDRSLAEYKEELETVSEKCQELRHLVNQLLELAETDAVNRKTNRCPVDLSSLVTQSINFFAGVAEEQEVEIVTSLEKDAVIHADESRLRQIVNNLVDNALKFTPNQGRIEICISKSESQVTLTILDSGPGVPEAELLRIFDRFYQVDRSRCQDSRRGNGLGLSICKSIVEMHRGTISASNSETGGLQVTVAFPIVPPQ